MATIPELLDGHITLEVECLDRLYLNGFIGRLATGIELSMFMRNQLGKPVPSPGVLGQVSERFREAAKRLAEREDIPVHQFKHEERKDDIANDFRDQRPVRDDIVFIGVAQEKAKTFNGKKVNGQFEFGRDKSVYVNMDQGNRDLPPVLRVLQRPRMDAHKPCPSFEAPTVAGSQRRDTVHV